MVIEWRGVEIENDVFIPGCDFGWTLLKKIGVFDLVVF